MNTPKISIITATYNSESTIYDTLHSVAGQTKIEEIEHLILDGNSKDRTLLIVDSFPHISSVIHGCTNGIYHALNEGIKHSSGDIIGILHSDDFYASGEVIEHVLNAFKDSNVEAVYGDLKYIDRFNTKKLIRYWKSGVYNRSSWKRGWMPPHPTFFVRKEAYLKYGNYLLDFKSAADYELMLRFCFKHRIKTAYLPIVMVNMRVGGVSNVSLQNRWRAHKEDWRAWKINNLEVPYTTLWMKPIRKISQWWRKPEPDSVVL